MQRIDEPEPVYDGNQSPMFIPGRIKRYIAFSDWKQFWLLLLQARFGL